MRVDAPGNAPDVAGASAPVDLLQALRVAALARGRAVPAFRQARIGIQPHALVVPAIALASEDASIHAAAISSVGLETPLRILAVADPRQRDSADEMFGLLDAHLERYYVGCEETGRAPQLVVTSHGALRHLTNIADDLRFLERNAAIARFATNLSYFTDRAEVPGQQAVVVLTDVLATHWVTPLQPYQEAHLGALLATLDPPQGQDVMELVRQAETLTMGPRTAPVFDNTALEPRLARYTKARRRGAPQEELDRHRDEIAAVLTPVVMRMHRAMQYGLRKLAEAALAPLPEVEAWQEAERDAFLRFRRARTAGFPIPRRDRAKGAAFRLVEREEGQATVEASVQCHDPLGRARAEADGELLACEVQGSHVERLSGQRRRVIAVEVVTQQTGLRLRRRDELTWIDDPRFEAVVADIRQSGRRLHVTLHLTRGMQRPGVPASGAQLALVRRVPCPERIHRVRRAMSHKLARVPWTHDHTIAPPDPRPKPVILPGSDIAAPDNHDPLALLEVLK